MDNLSQLAAEVEAADQAPSAAPEPAWPPPAWRMLRISVALLAAAVVMICQDMLIYLRLWRDIYELGGMPGPEDVLAMINTGLVPLALACGAFFTASWASFRAKGRYALLAVMTVVASALIAIILAIMLFAQRSPVALL